LLIADLLIAVLLIVFLNKFFGVLDQQGGGKRGKGVKTVRQSCSTTRAASLPTGN
jgi:hypothetical protein